MPASEIFFVVLPGTMLMDLAGVAEPFRLAGRFGGQFRLHFVGPRPQSKTFAGLVLQGVEELPAALPPGAVVFLPGVPVGGDNAPRPAAALVVAWLQRVMRDDVVLCTVCSGAFLAAQAGLLDGRRCTTHHAYAALLAHRHPRVRVVENRVFVQDGLVYSSAGISAGVDLALHLVAEFAGPRVALEVAKFLVLYMRRTEADPQLSPWVAHRNHLHPKVHRVQDLVIRDPGATWTVAALARSIHTSPRNLTRLFNTHVGMPPLTYLRKIRTAAAKELVTRSDLSLERVAEMSGFASAEQMRRAWLKFEGVRPTDARPSRRVNQSAA